MEKRIISIGEIKIVVHSFLDSSKLINNKTKFIEKIVKEIKESCKSKGFAGFKDEKGFENHLNYWIYEKPLDQDYLSNKISLEKCLDLIKETFEKIKGIIDKKEIDIYLFPTLSKFTLKKMNGVSGRIIFGNIIYFDLFPKENWEKLFKSSLIHEVAHLMNKYYSDKPTIKEAIIFEGLAEHFQETFTETKNPWTHVISKEEALELFEKLKPKINEKNFNLYSELFYGAGKYPLWAGYTIGYYLVENYLKTQKNLDWKKILKINPNKILDF